MTASDIYEPSLSIFTLAFVRPQHQDYREQSEAIFEQENSYESNYDIPSASHHTTSSNPYPSDFDEVSGIGSVHTKQSNSLLQAANHTDYFNSTYVVPSKVDKPGWDESFVQAVDDVRDRRPLLLLNRVTGGRTMDRIERYRKLAAGKVDGATTMSSRDDAAMKSEWQEEMDRKFGVGPDSGMRGERVISPRTESVNKDIRHILKMEGKRKERLREARLTRNAALSTHARIPTPCTRGP